MAINNIDKQTLRSVQLQADAMHRGEKAFRRASVADFCVLLSLALVLALCIRANLFQIIRVEGSSMLPNYRTNERVYTDMLIYRAREPQRGEVLICKYNVNGKLRNVPVIKRVIGLPGETIEVKDGSVFVDGEKLNESAYIDVYIDAPMPPAVVPKNCVFVMGDNRNGSVDSRSASIGPVPYKNIIGKALFLIWPLTELGRPAE